MTWSNEALENVIATLESGSRPTGGASIDGGEVLSIGGENILQSGGVTLEDVKRVPVAFFNRMTKGHLRDDDVLINKDGAQTGKVGWYHPGRALVACINEHVFLLRGDPAQITQGYLYYSLLSALGQAQIRLQISGSAQPGLKTGFTKGVNVDIPADLREQSMIVHVLSTVDRAIEETEALIAKQQRIKTGLMQDLLTRGIDEHGNLRYEKTHEFKDSRPGRIPIEWEVRSLGQCVRADAPICYGILMPGQGVDNGVPVIKVKDIVGGRIVQDNLLLTDRRIDRQYRRSRLRSGDLVITIRGTTGRLAVVPPELDGANITQDTARVRLSDDHSARFCFYCLQSESAQGQIALHTIGQAVKGINIGDVKRLLLGMPSLHEQERLANRFEGLEKTTHATSRALAKLKSTKAGLMQDLLTGNRRVTALLEQRQGVTT